MGWIRDCSLLLIMYHLVQIVACYLEREWAPPCNLSLPLEILWRRITWTYHMPAYLQIDYSNWSRIHLFILCTIFLAWHLETSQNNEAYFKPDVIFKIFNATLLCMKQSWDFFEVQIYNACLNHSSPIQIYALPTKPWFVYKW